MSGFDKDLDFGHTAALPSNEERAELSELVKDAELYEEEIAQIAEVLKDKSKRLDQLLEHDIPDCLLESGVEEITVLGMKVTIKKQYRGSILVADRPAAFDWLEKNKEGALVKRTVVVQFGNDELKNADKLHKQLDAKYANVKRDGKVEPATLKAFVKRKIISGESFPRELFGATEFRRAKITKTKG